MTLYEELVGDKVRYWMDETPSNGRTQPWVVLEVPDNGGSVGVHVIRRLRDRYPMAGLQGALKLWRERELKI